MRQLLSISFLFLACLPWLNAWAMDADELARKVYERYDGDDAYYRVEMTLIDRKGREKRREMEMYVKDFGGLNKTYIVFLSPKDIRGTAFLSIENPGDKDDTQYLYLPDLGRARRIVSSQRKNRFVNTDYTYEDMQRRKPEWDEHRILGEKRYLDRDCYILEAVPKRRSQYGRLESLVDKESFLVLWTDFYDKKGRKVKEFRAKEIKEVDGIWTIIDSLMHDLKRKHQTVMKVKDVRYNQGLSDELFTVRHLEKGLR